MVNLKCPNCSKEYVARVARVGFTEKLLSLFYIYPFKCQLCGCRFNGLQWGVRYFRVEDDRREYERLPTTFPVSFGAEAFDGKGMACNISMSGCTFQPEADANNPKEGSVLRMELQISNVLQPVNVEAVVRNVRQDHVGVEFLSFQPADKDRLQHYIRELLKHRRDVNLLTVDGLREEVARFGLGKRFTGVLGSLIPVFPETNKKKDLIQIQWFVTIACCYLLLFDKGQVIQDWLNILLLIAPLGCMLIFLRLPEAAFAHRLFPHTMAIADTILISTAIVVNKHSPWDLFLVYFFGIFIAAIGENLIQIVIACFALSVISVVIAPLSGKGNIEFDPSTLLRIPLFFGASVVYGYLSDQVKREKRRSAELETSRRQQLQMKDQFLSHVSHELRTPLTVVYQFVTILLDGIAGDLNEEQREYVEIVFRNVKQLQAMVADLLEATRANSGKLAIDPQVIVLQSFVSQTLEMLVAGAAIKGIVLRAEISDDLPFVYADPQRVSQILTNLIDNAIKFTPAQGTITVCARIFEKDSGWVHISVVDTGCGISPEGTQRIFERLYQEAQILDTNRKGLGLGLHICKELVSRHGGRIWVDSKIGSGSTFHFTLPTFSLQTLLVPLIEARDHSRPLIELISVELRLDKLSPASEPATAALQAVWNSLNPLGLRRGTVLLPKMAANQERGLIFLITAGDVTVQEVESAANDGIAHWPSVQSAACRIAVSATLIDGLDDTRIGLEERADEMTTKISKSITEFRANRSAAAIDLQSNASG
jgi:signal transduction histidine kinase